MKVKFDLSEDMRLKAYYLLQLSSKAGLPFEGSFDGFLNQFAAGQFEIGLDSEISKLESRLFSV